MGNEGTAKTARTESFVVPTGTFHDLFAGPGGIRVWIDWEELFRLSIPVRVTFASSIDDLEGGYLPWYLAPEGREVDFDDDARPVALAEFPDAESSLGKERREKIAALRAALASSESVHLLVPAYDLGGGRKLILDGCHRLAALTALPVRLKAVVFTLEGPLEPTVLPDLSRWRDGSG